MGIGKTRKVRAPTWNDLFHRRGPWRQLDHQKLKLHVRYLQLRFLRPGEKLLEIHSMDHLEGGAAGSSATNRKRQEKKQNSSLIDALSGFLQTWQRGQGDTWQHGKTTRKGLGGDNRERPHDKPSPAWLMTFKNVLIRLIGLLFSLSLAFLLLWLDLWETCGNIKLGGSPMEIKFIRNPSKIAEPSCREICGGHWHLLRC